MTTVWENVRGSGIPWICCDFIRFSMIYFILQDLHPPRPSFFSVPVVQLVLLALLARLVLLVLPVRLVLIVLLVRLVRLVLLVLLLALLVLSPPPALPTLPTYSTYSAHCAYLLLPTSIYFYLLLPTSTCSTYLLDALYLQGVSIALGSLGAARGGYY